MELVCDFHIHSHYSRATSKGCTLEGLYKWGKIKGINIIGTGDFTHPAWFAEIREKLEPAEPGLFRLKKEIAQAIDEQLPVSVRENSIKFIPTVEIATIYSKAGRVRKIHQLLVAPSFTSVSKINSQLDRIGNLKADGRPILGLDSKKLLAITVETDPHMLFIPAHIWTPWFGLHGSKSGFDSIKEAFEELSPNIFAVETGLSSDPYMNWRVNHLQNITITSHSDAHSPQKLGREATVLDCNLSYADIISAIKANDDRMVGTIEFFPEEGKYHYDGHRVCNVSLHPDETKKRNGICPKCGKQLTIGVDYRVNELASIPGNQETRKPGNQKSVEYIIPLVEMIAEMKKLGVSSKAVVDYYIKAIAALGNEFYVLRKKPIKDIKDQGFPDIAYAVSRMRDGDIHIEPGYDGVFGVITLFKDDNERKTITGQMSLI